MQVTVYINVTYSLNSIQKLHVVDILDIVSGLMVSSRIDNRPRRFNVLLREFPFNNLWAIDVFYDFRCDIKTVTILTDAFLSIEMI